MKNWEKSSPIFKQTFWGMLDYEITNEEIILNRYRFLSEYKIYKAIKYSKLEKEYMNYLLTLNLFELYIFDHLECYHNNEGNTVFVSSRMFEYNEKDDYDILINHKNSGFAIYPNNLYSKTAFTFIKVLNGEIK